jgi:hypothetical protein
MHNPKTIIEACKVIGHFNGTSLHRWTEEGGTRAFEERVVATTAASGTVYRGVMVFEVASA